MASAQTQPSDLAHATLEDLMNITITTATRTEQTVARVPARVTVVTADQVRKRGYRSLADVLKDLPDFKVDVGADFDYPTELTVDGVRGASRVIVLLDGIRISSPTNEPLPILENYPVHAARQVEIVYGPASALYGADAFSAVINIISHTVEGSPVVSASASVGQFGLYNETASYAARLGGGATILVDGQLFRDRQPDLSRYYPSVFGGLAGQRSGTFDSIFGPMTPSRRPSPGYDVPKSAHSLHATLRSGGWQLSLFESRSHTPTAPPQTPDNAVYNDDAFNGNALLVGAGAYTGRIGAVTSTTTVVASRHELDPQSGYWNVYNGFVRGYKYAYGSMWKGDEQLSWKPTPSLDVTVGGTYEHFYSIPQGADLTTPVASRHTPSTILGTNIPDDFIELRYSNAGAYAQAQFTASSRVTVTAGARSDYNTRYGATFNPRVGVVVEPSPHTTMKLLYGSAFLAPSPWQAYTHWGSFSTADGGATYTSDYWHLPNPELQPQHKQTIEGNLLQLLRPELTLSASLFYSRISNLVQIDDPDQAYAGVYHGWPVAYIDFPVNEGRAAAYGTTMALDFRRALSADRSVAARVGLTLADGRSSTHSVGATLPLGGMSPIQLRAAADFEWHGWTAAPRLSLVGAQRTLGTHDATAARKTLPGYATADIAVRRPLVFKHVGAFILVENAFDRRFVNVNNHAYVNAAEFGGMPQNPRRVTIGIDVSSR